MKYAYREKEKVITYSILTTPSRYFFSTVPVVYKIKSLLNKVLGYTTIRVMCVTPIPAIYKLQHGS